jgi:sigma-B regulation protein RsbU (phosphoserine phosphatase)
MPHSFSIGEATFAPAMITARPVTVGDKQWELFVTTSLTDVDGIVARLLNRGLLWCIFVVLSVTAILVSTAVQMIRSRMRMERLQHEALTRELSQARQIQLAWLPDPHPLSQAVDIAAVNSPASHISGDFYNWFELPDGRMVVTVGDVTGHGMAAAFLMATTQLLVRNTMVRVNDPGRCLEEVNRQLCVQVFNGQFVTMVIAILDLANGKLQVGTAGHPAPLVADGESFQQLPLEPQLVLGVDRDTRYETETFDLPSAASLLLYTDGVVECPDVRDARFGDERLRRALYGRYDTAQEMLSRVVSAVDTFRGGRLLNDDLTLVAVQLQPVHASDANVASIAI